MGRGTKTTDFLKECMADALLKLMRTTPIDKITISDIVETAGVGRTTWFRNFTSKSEAITFKLIRLWEKWTEENDVDKKYEFSTDNAETFFAFNLSIKRTLDTIYACGQQYALYEAFYSVLVKPQNTFPSKCYEDRFYSYGLFGLLDEWVKRDYKETPNEMAEMIPHFISKK